MAKKTASKVIPLLSPENYIRQKSKSLPLDKCLITEGWEDVHEATIVIMRRHVTGNVTACMYLVDWDCLGVKDTHYFFNEPYEKVMEELTDDLSAKFVETTYELAHNIIYAGIDFAEKYEFYPCKDFTSITQYFLEDDTDDIPLMEIRCGNEEDGQPVYVNAGYETPAQVQKILAQLERIAGDGNYHYIARFNNEDDDYDDEEDDDEEDDENENDEEYDKIESEIDELSLEEQKKLFVKLLSKEEDKEDFTAEDANYVMVLTHSLPFKMVSEETIEKGVNILEEKFKHEITDDRELPNSLFAGVKEKSKLDTEILECFYDAYFNEYGLESMKEDVADFRNEAGDVPAADFLDLLYLRESRSKKYNKELSKFFREYPDYFLIQTLYYSQFDADEKTESKENLEKLFFEWKRPLTEFEVEHFFRAYTFYFMEHKNTTLSDILAYEKYICTRDFIFEETQKAILFLTQFAKMGKLLIYLKQPEELERLKNE